MTHVPESEFQKTVAENLEEEFPDATIQTGWDTRLDESGRYPDIILSTKDFGNFVIEVENDFEAAFKGVGQALVYSAETGYTPAVVLPEGHVEEPEWSFMHLFVHAITMETK